MLYYMLQCTIYNIRIYNILEQVHDRFCTVYVFAVLMRRAFRFNCSFLSNLQSQRGKANRGKQKYEM